MLPKLLGINFKGKIQKVTYTRWTKSHAPSVIHRKLSPNIVLPPNYTRAINRGK